MLNIQVMFPRSSRMEKKSIVFSIAITANVIYVACKDD
jgi:hypothetical protein